MAGHHALFALATGGALLLAADPRIASAQCRLCSEPTTVIAEDKASPLQVEVETMLDFDRLVLTGAGEGEAALLPSGERGATGSVALVSSRAMIGTVAVRGEPGRAVQVDLPRRIEMYSSNGGRIALDRIETDLPSFPKLDSSGTLTFRFGGRLELRGEAEGDFRGDIPISVDYL